MKRSWKIKPTSESIVQKLCSEAGLSPLMAHLLYLRGVHSPEQAKIFLSPAKQDIPSPYSFSEMSQAVERIQQAIEKRERILIHGDYDVDGITGACILLETFSALGIDADYFLPNRMESGYGVQVETVRERLGDYDLLITVDCGTTAIEAVRTAQEGGLDVVVTDHHNAGDERPPAVAVLNPVRSEESYPSKNLSGAGVAWKLASALFETYSRSDQADALLDLVALGMVADVVPLRGENRTLLARALNEFHRFDRPGLRALMDLSKVLPGQIDAQAIGFRLGPRLNAAGRMDKPDLALELLLTRDEGKAQELARHLHQLNAQRQNVEAKILQEACAMIENDGLLDRSPSAVVAVGDHWHRGVLGIVAARLVQMCQRSVFLLSREEEIAIGSARSMDGVDLIPLLDAGRPHAISCGGHAGAGGVKVAPDQIPAFTQAIYAAAEQIETPSEPPALWADASILLEQIDAAFMSEMKRLEPFGEGNEEPLFLSRGTINGVGARIVGNNHLRLTLRHPRGAITAIGFGQGDKLESLHSPEVEIAFHCRWNEFQGRRNIDLHLKDVRSMQQSQTAVPLHNSSSKIGFQWDRASLGEIYLSIKDSCDEENAVLNNTPVLMQLVKACLRKKQRQSNDAKQEALLTQVQKISPSDFDAVLKIFMEIELLAIRGEKIIILEVKKKRNLTDSPTYQKILEKLQSQ